MTRFISCFLRTNQRIAWRDGRSVNFSPSRFSAWGLRPGLFLALLIHGLATGQEAPELNRPAVRAIPVTVAVDRSCLQEPDWQQQIGRRITLASRQLEQQVGLQLVIVSVVPWQCDSRVDGQLAALQELQAEVPRRQSQLVLGFVQETKPASLEDFRTQFGPQREELELLGLAPNFSGYALIRDVILADDTGEWRIMDEFLTETLIHELGHVFGAVHVVRRDSVMRRGLGEQAAFQFDPVNAAIVRAAKWMDFHRGLSSLSRTELGQMIQGYETLLQGQVADGGADFYLGALAQFTKQDEKAIAAYHRALRWSPRDAYTHYNLGTLYERTGQWPYAVAEWQIVQRLGGPRSLVERAEAALRRVAAADVPLVPPQTFSDPRCGVSITLPYGYVVPAPPLLQDLQANFGQEAIVLGAFLSPVTEAAIFVVASAETVQIPPDVTQQALQELLVGLLVGAREGGSQIAQSGVAQMGQRQGAYLLTKDPDGSCLALWGLLHRDRVVCVGAWARSEADWQASWTEIDAAMRQVQWQL